VVVALVAVAAVLACREYERFPDRPDVLA